MDKRALAELKATKEVLEMFARGTNRREYLHSLLGVIQSWSRCEYIGIRLVDHRRHIPYEASCGFDEAFLEKEHDLSLEKDQCVCTRVILGSPEPQDAPWVTRSGSFVTNNSLDLAASLTREQLLRFRGRCIESGFLSIAVIPIRCREEILGALHLADRRPGAFRRDEIEFIESLVPLIGEAVHRFSVEDLLREKEALFRGVFDQTLQFMAVLNLNGAVRDVNQASLTFFGQTSKSCWLGVPFWDLPGWGRYVETAWLRGAVAEAGAGHLVRRQLEVVGADGVPATLDFSLKPVKDLSGQTLYLIAEGRDISESKRLERQILEITSQQQHQIGSELHEVLGQDMVGIAMLSRILEQRLKEHSLPEADEAARIAELARRAASEARGLAMNLCVTGHGRDNLASVLRILAAAIQRQHGIVCTVEGDSNIKVCNPTVTGQLMRIVQDAADGAVRHGRVSRVTVTLVDRPDGFDLTIRDDRQGLTDESACPAAEVEIMKYRASTIGGMLDARRDPAGGTVITFSCRGGLYGCPRCGRQP